LEELKMKREMRAVSTEVNLPRGGKNIFSEQVRHAFTGCVVALAVFSLVSLAHGQEPPQYSPTFRSFSGACRHTRGPLPPLYDNALGWGRQDIPWEVLEPTPNGWSQWQLESFGNLVLAYNAKDAHLLPILDYGTFWAGGYRFIDNEHVADWQNYVERVVDFLRKPPYNVKYFQIWNEAHPCSGFWDGDMDTYMTNVHLPAAEVIHNLDCKVVYGGWPFCSGLSNLVGLLDAHNAWDSVDVLSMHYLGVEAWEYLRDAAAARGYENIPIWETEVGYTTDLHYISNFYPRMFYWALTHNADASSDMYKIFYYREESSDTPGTEGYHKTLYSGSSLWHLGESLQTLADLFDNGIVSDYQSVVNNRSLTPQQSLYNSSIESFRLYDRVVTAIHLDADDVSNPSTDTITLTYWEFQCPSDVGSVKRVDVAGYETDLTGSYGVSGLTVTVPVANDPCSPVQNWGLDSSVYNFYVVVTRMGSLSVTINPQGAIDAGAQWRRAGTSTWRNSGDTESGIPVGQYTVEFKDITGWRKPSNQGVTISGGETTNASGTYVLAVIYRVDVNATGADNGSSWADAYTGLQSALSVAAGKDEIWVARGTYKPTTGTDRTISFVMRQGVAIYGGFAGTETSQDQRNWVANPTILSGDIGTQGDNSDNSYHVVIGANNATLDGFMITDGNANGEDWPHYVGGGIYIDGASPIIEKNVITSNSASSEGGGIYCQGGSAMIRYNKISNNYSFFVGGVSFESSFAVLQNNLIVDNTADYDSGVACLEGQPRIVNNTIAGNVSVYDNDSSGLLIASFSLSPIISNNIIAFNYGAPGVVDFGGFDPNYFSYNDVYGHPNGNYLSWVLPTPDQTGVNGNISVNPLFADTDANDYHLLPESLLIDAGDLSSDWSNEPRPNGGRINMGAYGNTSEASCSLAGDITWDKKVDFKDFAKLAFYWLQNEPSVDIAPLVSGDNIVDVGDLAVLAEHWLEGI
jgi:hypothetical protein